MYKFFFRFIVITITILTANLLTTAISDYLIIYRHHVKPIVFTFIGMGVIVIIFYPLFTKLEEWVKTISTRFIKTGKNVGGKYIGLFLAFILAMLVLCYFYARMWYNIDLLRSLLNGTITNYI
ncbi:MAG TPA: hypothetical protein VHO50_01030 [Bacteroidales bacterium]|nr:hypothetical protein [Bacteroidales bacterium]